MTQSPPKDISVATVEVSFFVHATEDLEKVFEAVWRILPEENAEEITFGGRDLRGYYGNPIRAFKAVIRKKPIIAAVINNLSTTLEAEDKEYLYKNLERHLNGKSKLYLRLDKQAAYLGYVKLGYSDPIHITMRLSITLKHHKDIASILNRLSLI